MTAMEWTDISEIAMALNDCHPDTDPQYISFQDMHRHILALEGFIGHPERCNERILEAIQAAWIEEASE